MTGIDSIPAATAEDLRAFDTWVADLAGKRCEGYQYETLRVACHFSKRVAEAERLLRAYMAKHAASSMNAEVEKFLEAK